MVQNTEIVNWNSYKIQLKKKYPQLTNADLTWRYTTSEDLMKTISQKLGMTKRELEESVPMV